MRHAALGCLVSTTPVVYNFLPRGYNSVRAQRFTETQALSKSFEGYSLIQREPPTLIVAGELL
jgi:hypothetical protein